MKNSKIFNSFSRFAGTTRYEEFEGGIRVKGYLTVFNEVNENGYDFTPESYDRACDYYVKAGVDIPLCLFHRDNTIADLVGVVTDLNRDSHGIAIVAEVYDFSPSFNWVKNAIDKGMLNGFSNCGYIVNAKNGENGTLVIEDFVLMHAALVPMPADVKATFSNTRITLENGNENKEAAAVEAKPTVYFF